jgi:hypothetical protein
MEQVMTETENIDVTEHKISYILKKHLITGSNSYFLNYLISWSTIAPNGCHPVFNLKFEKPTSSHLNLVIKFDFYDCSLKIKLGHNRFITLTKLEWLNLTKEDLSLHLRIQQIGDVAWFNGLLPCFVDLCYLVEFPDVERKCSVRFYKIRTELDHLANLCKEGTEEDKKRVITLLEKVLTEVLDLPVSKMDEFDNYTDLINFILTYKTELERNINFSLDPNDSYIDDKPESKSQSKVDFLNFNEDPQQLLERYKADRHKISHNNFSLIIDYLIDQLNSEEENIKEIEELRLINSELIKKLKETTNKTPLGLSFKEKEDLDTKILSRENITLQEAWTALDSKEIEKAYKLISYQDTLISRLIAALSKINKQGCYLSS